MMFKKDLIYLLSFFSSQAKSEQEVQANAKEQMDLAIMNIHSMDNKSYLHKYVVPTLLKGLSEMYEVRPRSPIEWLADWLEENNPFKN